MKVQHVWHTRGYVLPLIGLLGVCPLLHGQEPLVKKPTELACFRGHTNEVMSLAISADGRTLASGSFDKTVRIWDLGTGKERVTLRGHLSLIDFVAMTPDGKSVASADQAGVVKLWDLATGREPLTLAHHNDRLGILMLTNDGRTLVWNVGAARFYRWDVNAAQMLPALRPGPDEILTPEGRLLNWGKPEILAFSPDGKSAVASVGRDGPVQIWEVGTRQLRGTLQGAVSKELRRVAFHPGGRFIACANRKGSDGVKIVDVATGERLFNLTGDNKDRFADVVFSADGNTLAVAEGPDTAIRVWDVSGFWNVRVPVKEPLSEQDLEALWTDLAGNDAASAHRAIWILAGASKQAAPWIGQRLRPIVAADAQRTAALIADLDNGAFAVRDRATRELEKLGESAGPALRKALTARSSQETRRRAEALLEKLEALAPERLRELRTVEALEHGATAEALKVLEQWAGGMAEARLTREAKASLERLSKR